MAKRPKKLATRGLFRDPINKKSPTYTVGDYGRTERRLVF